MSRPELSWPEGRRLLANAASRLSRWRGKRTGRRIPENLWKLAAELGSRFGVSRTARALGLSYYDLRARVESAPASKKVSVKPAFVELLAPAPQLSTETAIELENAVGAKMRMHFKGGSETGLVALWRLFLEQRR